LADDGHHEGVEQVSGATVQGARAVSSDELGHDTVGLAEIGFGSFQERWAYGFGFGHRLLDGRLAWLLYSERLGILINTKLW
jgi:hypothetical protein